MQENREQALVQIKTRKYSATPIKGVTTKGNFALTMARKTSVDVSPESMAEEEPECGQKNRSGRIANEGVCFICCGSS
ncbi:MAG: hypothetical protein ACM3PE_06335 [Deltaproteobacteria bacterium]